MKYLFLFCFAGMCPFVATAQHKTNPDTIYQPCDIYIQNTDVYYYPFKPPAPTDTRAQLSAMASELRNPDGIRNNIDYTPVTHDTELLYWKPWGVPIGANAVWMRLFTAMSKPDGSPSDIVAGDSITSDTTPGQVIVDSMEDVDFRATGTIKLENGVHILPGAEFHAYIAPNWDTGVACSTAGDSGSGLVFCDEFDSYLSQWAITNGYGGDATIGLPNASFISNAKDTLDPDAFDGHALRISLTEDTCNCHIAYQQSFNSATSINKFGGDTISSCTNYIPDSTKFGTYQFSTAAFLSCPFPFKNEIPPLQPVSQNSPYGCYEVRLKSPIVMHHLNNWGDGQSDEFNLGEAYGGDEGNLFPGPTHRFRYGPFKGLFSYDSSEGVSVFRSSMANFTPWNNPTSIIINNFLYEVNLKIDRTKHPHDTILKASGTTLNEGGFPTSLAISTDSITFYYSRYGINFVSDSLPWSIDSTGKYFSFPSRDSAAYGIDSHGDTLYFNKSYQPTFITIPTALHENSISFSCHWDHLTGKIIFTPPIPDSMARSGTLPFQYSTNEGPAYPVPGMLVDTSIAKYHTYRMEILPHEARLLIDGAVQRRWPDRLIPSGDQRYDYMTYFPRTPMNLRIAEFDMDASTFATGKADFESKFGINGTAYQWVDYAKIWDMPTGSQIVPYPR